MVKNWKYYEKNETIGELAITKGQYMTGNILGILVEEKAFSDPAENLVNAKTFDFPVRYKTVRRYTGKNYNEVADDICAGISELELEGCRAVITSGGSLGFFHNIMHEATDLLVLSSPLEVIPLARVSISQNQYLCVVNSLRIEDNIALMRGIGIDDKVIEKCIFTNVSMGDYKCSDNKVYNGEIRLIGAYIWDCIECPDIVLGHMDRPVYSMVKLARLIKNAVMQMPYEGGI